MCRNIVLMVSDPVVGVGVGVFPPPPLDVGVGVGVVPPLDVGVGVNVGVGVGVSVTLSPISYINDVVSHMVLSVLKRIIFVASSGTVTRIPFCTCDTVKFSAIVVVPNSTVKLESPTRS